MEGKRELVYLPDSTLSNESLVSKSVAQTDKSGHVSPFSLLIKTFLGWLVSPILNGFRKLITLTRHVNQGFIALPVISLPFSSGKLKLFYLVDFA